MSSDHFIYASGNLYIHITLLLTSFISHGFKPDSFLRNDIRSISKGHNQNLTDSDNYHGIAISSVCGTLIDNFVLLRYHHLLASCDLQFDFKPGHSTQVCTMILKEIIS